MPITKSVKKNVRVIKRKTQINKSRKSKIKTFFNKVMQAIKEKKLDQAKKAFVDFESQIMKGVSKGTYKKNTASRKLRRTADKIRNLNGKKKPEKVKKLSKISRKPKKTSKIAKSKKIKTTTKK